MRCNEDVGFIVEHLHNAVTPIANFFFLSLVKATCKRVLVLLQLLQSFGTEGRVGTKAFAFAANFGQRAPGKVALCSTDRRTGGRSKETQGRGIPPTSSLFIYICLSFFFSLFSLTHTFCFASSNIFSHFIFFLPSLSLSVCVVRIFLLQVYEL